LNAGWENARRRACEGREITPRRAGQSLRSPRRPRRERRELWEEQERQRHPPQALKQPPRPEGRDLLNGAWLTRWLDSGC
jgi:hypothetical protein